MSLFVPLHNQHMTTIDESREIQIEEMINSIDSTSRLVQTQEEQSTNQLRTQNILQSDKVEEEAQYDDAPPPYSSADNGISQIEIAGHIIQARHSEHQKEQVLKAFKNQPPLLMELFMGHKLSKKLNNRRQKKRLAKLEEVHDSWLRLGLDTRAIFHGESHLSLPPSFWNPPKYNAAEMNRRLAMLI